MSRHREPLPTDVASLPPLASGYVAVLEAGTESLGLTLEPAVRRAIDDHVRLLLAWTAAINLTSIREPAAVALQHVLDSLSAVALLRARGARAILDLGSGGGFPGLPVALALPADRVLLVESVGKKAAFLAATIDALHLRPRAAVAATRAETLAGDPRHRDRWPAVTARAVATLPELVELALPLAAPRGALVAWKRRQGGATDPFVAELAAASRAAEALGGTMPMVHPVALPGLIGHVLVVVEKTHPTPPGFPRDPAARKRRPW